MELGPCSWSGWGTASSQPWAGRGAWTLTLERCDPTVEFLHLQTAPLTADVGSAPWMPLLIAWCSCSVSIPFHLPFTFV